MAAYTPVSSSGVSIRSCTASSEDSADYSCSKAIDGLHPDVPISGPTEWRPKAKGVGSSWIKLFFLHSAAVNYMQYANGLDVALDSKVVELEFDGGDVETLTLQRGSGWKKYRLAKTYATATVKLVVLAPSAGGVQEIEFGNDVPPLTGPTVQYTSLEIHPAADLRLNEAQGVGVGMLDEDGGWTATHSLSCAPSTNGFHDCVYHGTSSTGCTTANKTPWCTPPADHDDGSESVCPHIQWPCAGGHANGLARPFPGRHCAADWDAQWSKRHVKSLDECKRACFASATCAGITVGTHRGVDNVCVLCASTETLNAADWATAYVKVERNDTFMQRTEKGVHCKSNVADVLQQFVPAASDAGSSCTFAMGDGTGGTEKYLMTTQSKEDCETHVLANEAAANGVTWGTSNLKCYAEYGMTGTKSSAGYMSCMLQSDDVETAKARDECEAYCLAHAACQACSVHCAGALCQWNAIPECGGEGKWTGKTQGDVSRKVSPNWKIVPTACSSSSEYDSRYTCSKAFDGSVVTAWATKGEGVGSWIWLQLDGAYTLATMDYANRGGNERNKVVRLEFSDGSTQQVTLQNSAATARLILTPVSTTFVKIVVISVYSTYHNGANEISFGGHPVRTLPAVVATRASNSPHHCPIFYQMGTGGLSQVSGVVVQGSTGHPRSFLLQYFVQVSNGTGATGDTWFPVDGGAVFSGVPPGARGKNSAFFDDPGLSLEARANAYFDKPVVATFVRLCPLAWSGGLSLRAGLLVPHAATAEHVGVGVDTSNGASAAADIDGPDVAGGGWILIFCYDRSGPEASWPTVLHPNRLPTSRRGSGCTSHAQAQHLRGITQSDVESVRFLGQSFAEDGRTIHFKTENAAVVQMAWNGDGGLNEAHRWLRGWSPLPGHSAHLPAETNNAQHRATDAFNDHPFYKSSAYHWNTIVSRDGTEQRWDVDDWNRNKASGPTLHQVWVRLRGWQGTAGSNTSAPGRAAANTTAAGQCVCAQQHTGWDPKRGQEYAWCDLTTIGWLVGTEPKASQRTPVDCKLLNGRSVAWSWSPCTDRNGVKLVACKALGECKDSSTWVSTHGLGCEDYANAKWCKNEARNPIYTIPFGGQNTPGQHCCGCGRRAYEAALNALRKQLLARPSLDILTQPHNTHCIRMTAAQQDTDYNGNDLVNFAVATGPLAPMSAELCELLCGAGITLSSTGHAESERVPCQHWTFRSKDQVCVFKGSAVGRRHSKGFVSGPACFGVRNPAALGSWFNVRHALAFDTRSPGADVSRSTPQFGPGANDTTRGNTAR